MDQITDHQPDIQNVDLTSDESADDLSSSPASQGHDTQSEYVAESIRFDDYFKHYSVIIMQLINEIEEEVLKHGGHVCSWKEIALDRFIMYLMSNDDYASQ